MQNRVLDLLRAIFPYAVAFFLPPSGVILAASSYSEGNRLDARGCRRRRCSALCSLRPAAFS